MCGTGKTITYPASDPGASSISFVVPAGPPRKITAVNAIFTSSATLGQRELALRVTNKMGTRVCICKASFGQADALVYDYCWAPGMLQGISGEPVNCCMPRDIWLEDGDVVSVQDERAVDAAADRLSGFSIATMTADW